MRYGGQFQLRVANDSIPGQRRHSLLRRAETGCIGELRKQKEEGIVSHQAIQHQVHAARRTGGPRITEALRRRRLGKGRGEPRG